MVYKEEKMVDFLLQYYTYLNTCPPVHKPDQLKPQQLGQEYVDLPVQSLREWPYRQEQYGLQRYANIARDQERINRNSSAN